MAYPAEYMGSVRRQTGTSLMEILVTLWVLAIGLLGLAALNTRVIQAKLESYQRVEALLWADTIANIIRTHPDCLQNSQLREQCLPEKPALTGLQTCIQFESGNRIIISVAWLGMFETVAPNNPCGTDHLGANTRRRIVTTVASHALE